MTPGGQMLLIGIQQKLT